MSGKRGGSEKKQGGQAMVEMVLSISILVLMAAGIAQLSVLFLARTQFDHACGEAAREYNASLIQGDDAFQTELWNQLGYYRKFFDRNSIQVTKEKASNALSFWTEGNKKGLGFLDSLFDAVSKARDLVFNYGGWKWTVTIDCRPPLLFAPLFPRGVPLTAQFAVLKHPKGD